VKCVPDPQQLGVCQRQADPTKVLFFFFWYHVRARAESSTIGGSALRNGEYELLEARLQEW
jgi:hypothetical protein